MEDVLKTVVKVFSLIFEHHVEILYALLSLVAFLEVVVRFTKTEKDDGFVERLGQKIRKLMDALKVPNNKK